MKKKLLLFFALAAVMCCFLAIAVSAAQIPEWTDITEVSGMPDKSVFSADGMAGATSRVLMSDGVTYPAYYICKNATTLGISFSDLNSKSGKSYAAKDVVRIEIPAGTIVISDALKVANGYSALLTVDIPEGTTTINSHAFKSPNTNTNSALVSVTIPSTVNTIGEQAFYCCNSLEELVLPEGITEIPLNMAYGASSLKSVNIPSTVVKICELAFRSNTSLACDIVIPEGCTTIDSYAFKNTRVTSVTLPSTLESLGKEIFMDCSALTAVYSKSPIIGANMFYHCDELATIQLENTVEIGNLAFNNASLSKVSVLELPEGLTSIGEYAFPRMSITSVVIPSTVETVGQYAFTANKKLTKVVVLGPTIGTNMFNGCSALRTFVITENLETYGVSALTGVPQDSFTSYYTGTDYERIKTLCSESTRFNQASYCSYADYVSGNYTSKKFMAIYACNICTVGFDGHHSMSGNAKMQFDGFFDKITFADTCTRQGCGKTVIDDERTIDALFTYKGYSVAEYGEGGIDIGYQVNRKAVGEYEKATGTALNYGVFAVLADNIGDKDIFDESGAPRTGVIGADMTDSDYSIFRIKMAGFGETQLDIDFAMGAYVGITKGAATEYSYLQIADASEGEKYFFASYNDIVAMASPKE